MPTGMWGKRLVFPRNFPNENEFPVYSNVGVSLFSAKMEPVATRRLAPAFVGQVFEGRNARRIASR